MTDVVLETSIFNIVVEPETRVINIVVEPDNFLETFGLRAFSVSRRNKGC